MDEKEAQSEIIRLKIEEDRIRNNLLFARGYHRTAEVQTSRSADIGCRNSIVAGIASRGKRQVRESSQGNGIAGIRNILLGL